MEHLVSLGFDCRDARGVAVEKRWSRQRRSQFLLDPNIECPVSVDTTVLPSVFPDFNAIPDEFAPAVQCLPVGWGSRVVTRSWPDLPSLLAALMSHEPALPMAEMIVLESVLHVNAKIVDDKLWSGIVSISVDRTDGEHTREGDHRRKFLGHDIADSSGISALMNCGYQPDEVGRLRSEWVGQLNHVGLIPSLDEAQEFLHMSNERIASHAPFAIFALFQWSNPS